MAVLSLEMGLLKQSACMTKLAQSSLLAGLATFNAHLEIQHSAFAEGRICMQQTGSYSDTSDRLTNFLPAATPRQMSMHVGTAGNVDNGSKSQDQWWLRSLQHAGESIQKCLTAAALQQGSETLAK